MGRTADGTAECACYFADGTWNVPATLRTAHGLWIATLPVAPSQRGSKLSGNSVHRSRRFFTRRYGDAGAAFAQHSSGAKHVTNERRFASERQQADTRSGQR